LGSSRRPSRTNVERLVHRLPEAQAGAAVHEPADPALEVVEIRLLVHVSHEGHAEVAQHLGHPFHVALLDGEDQLDDVQPLLELQLAHHAGVEEVDLAGLQAHQQVAGVWVGVEEAVDQAA
jgi:hypothetical protein